MQSRLSDFLILPTSTREVIKLLQTDSAQSLCNCKKSLVHCGVVVYQVPAAGYSYSYHHLLLVFSEFSGVQRYARWSLRRASFD